MLSYYREINSVLEAWRGKDIFLAKIPKGINSVDRLDWELFARLQFPSYYGFNANALYDCLGDFHWMEKRHVVLIFSDIPALKDWQLAIYVDVLANSVLDWQKRLGDPWYEKLGIHELHVYFPERCRKKVEWLLAEQPEPPKRKEENEPTDPPGKGASGTTK